MQLNESDIGPTVEASVISSQRITSPPADEARRIRLYVDDPSFRFSEGQTIGVVVPGPHPFGNQYHMRRYSIASSRLDTEGDGLSFDLLVRRCFLIDEVSGERYPGIASNYLCDASEGDRITLSGPYRSPFSLPADKNANLLMIGTGTGVAPFRAFVQNIYTRHGGWDGEVRLFYGARSGMDLLYANDEVDDLTNYYDEKSFRAFKAVIDKPLQNDSAALKSSFSTNAEEIWSLINDERTYVYIAGIDKVAAVLDRAMAGKAGSSDNWNALKQRLIDDKRWSELIYE